jgi:hypothetical protein
MANRQHLAHLASVALTTGIALTHAAEAEAAPKKGAKATECFGINSCKGTNGCAVSLEQIAAAKAAFASRFTKTKPVDCAGTTDCSSKNGFLAWTAQPTNEACFNADGFIFTKDAAGKLIIRDKSGDKKPA